MAAQEVLTLTESNIAGKIGELERRITQMREALFEPCKKWLEEEAERRANRGKALTFGEAMIEKSIKNQMHIQGVFDRKFSESPSGKIELVRILAPHSKDKPGELMEKITLIDKKIAELGSLRAIAERTPALIGKYMSEMKKRYTGEIWDATANRVDRILEDMDKHGLFGLWLYGPKMVGKTYLIHSVAKRLISSGIVSSWHLTSLAEIQDDHLAQGKRGDLYSAMENKDLIFIDDPILKMKDSYYQELAPLMWRLLESDAIKMFSSNNKPEDTKAYDARLLPRIKEMCLVYHVTEAGMELER